MKCTVCNKEVNAGVCCLHNDEITILVGTKDPTNYAAYKVWVDVIQKKYGLRDGVICEECRIIG